MAKSGKKAGTPTKESPPPYEVLAEKLKVEYVPLASLRHAEYNPRVINDATKAPVRVSIEKHGLREPLIVNRAKGRENIIIGGNLRAEVCKDLGLTEVPVVFVDILDLAQEKDLCIRLNKAVGEWDQILLAALGEDFLVDTGFDSEEIDKIIGVDETPELFDLKKELDKLNIKEINIKHGDIFEWPDGSRVMNGDSTIESDMLKLMDGAKADMCLTDPPYLLDYLHGKKKKGGKATQGFGLKRDRQYLGTDVLPPDFTEKWMASVAKVAKPDFSIIIFENPKNLRTIWNELEKHWKYRNTITWHVPNRVSGFSAKYRFFNKTDIALVGTGENFQGLNLAPEEELFQNEYENALYATSGKPHWEPYEKGKKIQPTDFIDHVAADAKSSGQSIIFGTKPIELLIPYAKVLTRRENLILEPFGGSGSTAVAAFKLGRKFRMMEKSEVYTAVIINRLTKVIGVPPKKI